MSLEVISVKIELCFFRNWIDYSAGVSLEVIDASMNFGNLLLVKTCFLEMSVDIACVDMILLVFQVVTDAKQSAESFVRLLFFINIVPVSVEKPKLVRL